jgi:hypothetical protein
MMDLECECGLRDCIDDRDFSDRFLEVEVDPDWLPLRVTGFLLPQFAALPANNASILA